MIIPNVVHVKIVRRNFCRLGIALRQAFERDHFIDRILRRGDGHSADPDVHNFGGPLHDGKSTVNFIHRNSIADVAVLTAGEIKNITKSYF